jgi:dihydrodipicolinate synthase/N-acetylneuraminate lyase
MLQEIKRKFFEQVRGPVFPIPIPFRESGDVDYDGLRRYVEFLLGHGAVTLMVTVGTSRFDVLTIEEMKKVNEVVAETANGKAIVIVTTPTKGPTSQAIDFAKHAEAIGADGILAVYPDRYYSDNDVAQFFEDIAASCSIGVLIHLMAIPAGKSGLGPQVQYSPELVERIAALGNFVGIKEESHDQALSYKYSRSLAGKIVIIGGAGGMRDYLTKYNWGQQAYLVGLGNFVPELEVKFYNAVIQGDLDTARKIIFEYEEPFFTVAVEAGWHLALKEALAFFDLMKPWEREPISRITSHDRDKIIDNLKSKKWI